MAVPATHGDFGDCVGKLILWLNFIERKNCPLLDDQDHNHADQCNSQRGCNANPV
jgi:hypothetical protein